MKAIVAVLLLASSAASQADAGKPFSTGGRDFSDLGQAVSSLGGRDGTISVAPGRYRDCAVITGGAVTLRAATPSAAIFDGGACEGKATLVLRGASATVDGLVFQNVRMPDRNGAGIRLEAGDLTVIRSTFRDSEQGILSANDSKGTVRIEQSTFSGLGGCPDGMCSHSIYLNGTGALTVTRTRFERGTGGHYLKSRTPRVSITESSFDDTRGRVTNYMIDLPAGATGVIARNTFVQGRDKENYSAFIAVAAESREHRSAGLQIAENDASIAPGVERRTIFVADWSGERLALGANRLGKGLTAYERR